MDDLLLKATHILFLFQSLKSYIFISLCQLNSCLYSNTVVIFEQELVPQKTTQGNITSVFLLGDRKDIDLVVQSSQYEMIKSQKQFILDYVVYIFLNFLLPLNSSHIFVISTLGPKQFLMWSAKCSLEVNRQYHIVCAPKRTYFLHSAHVFIYPLRGDKAPVSDYRMTADYCMQR